ncbi:NACHT and WD repeat domain-containing protein [Nonomuraea jiangxiensis]|uniref:WD40 repeat n=1 Tax=Nonomuraea jiangxiensis TaxID=633440 RepID=A0A1G8I8D9_9ACTN|nr:AAA family ATPase [Nonomuraea jiangxiensis]SDI14820.1 WD40 repeat [Nonomuraea jiangxiensis]
MSAMGERRESGHPDDVCPYQGLAPFESRRSELFFGRTRATRGLLDRLGRRLTDRGSILLVSGASGVGKSSLLRAGLLPALAEGMLPVAGSRDWPCLLLTPAANPFLALCEGWSRAFGGRAETVLVRLREDPRRALAEVLPPGGRLVLVVDQFEELFTLVTDERERQAFVRTLHALTEGRDGAAVIVGVRADYWDRCAAYPQFAEAIQDGQVIVEPMTESDLRLAITGPAATVGLDLEPGLVETILGELRDGRPAGDRYEAGALPLLSQALRNTWERREDGTLTLRGYEESGRVRDSVRRTADEVLGRLTPEDRRSALRFFRRMTVITAGGQVARRRATLTELHAAAAAHSPERRERAGALLSAFAGRRLLTLHEDSAEIAHDALLTAWPTLRQWIEPDLAAQAVYERLLDAAGQWAENHRDPAFLYRGARLLAVQDSRPHWERDPDSFPPPGPTAEGFLAASTREARRAGRRRRLVMAGLALLSVLALLAAGTAVNAASEADAQRKVASSRQLAAQSEVTGDAALSSMLAVAAWDIAHTDEARNRVLSAAIRTGRGVLTGHTRGVMALAFSSDGSVIATGSDDGTARLWDAATRRQLGAPITREKYECSEVHLALSPDGRTLATACLDTVRFYDVATHRERGAPLRTGEVVSALAYNPDGKTFVTGDFTGVVRQWDAVTRRPYGPAMGRAKDDLSSRIQAVAYSRDGRTLATASNDKTARLWDTATARRLGAPLDHGGTVADVAFSPDGATLATASWDRTARLWDVATGKQTGVLRDRTAGFYGIAFSPDGTRLATAGASGRTVLWDTASRQQLMALSDNSVSVERVAFSPDGRLLAAASGDGVTRLADPRTHLQLGTPMPARTTVALSPDGRTLAAGVAREKDPAIQLWDVATQRPLGPPLRPEGARRSVSSIEFAPDGRTLVASSLDGLWLWDVASRREIARDEALKGVARLSPDGRYVAVQRDQAIAFWDLAGRKEVGPRISVPDHTGVLTGMAISPDGAILASAGFDNRLRLFDVATRREIPGPRDTVAGGFVNALAFSPDGRKLAFTASDNAVRLWDMQRRRPAGIALIIEDAATNALAFSPDSQVLATGDTGGGVRLWDLRVNRQLGTPMTGHGRGVTAVAYGRDGTSVASVADDGTARLWNVRTPPDIEAAACANAGRSLTREEWESLVRQEEYRRTCQ